MSEPSLVMIVFCLPQHRALVPDDLDEASELVLGRWRFGRFADGELWLELDDAVAGRECAVLGSLAPPDEQTLLTLLLADTLRREGARRVVALLPYLGYARQDRPQSRRSLGAAWVGALLAASGIHEVVTIDIHSADAQASFAMPLVSLSPASLFAGELLALSPSELTVVAPDEGAIDRCMAVADAAGVSAPVAHLRKRRTAQGVAHVELVGDVGEHVVMVDDILDTGGTLLSACAELCRAGVREILIMATHGTLSTERWRDLPAAGAARIWLTDSVPGVRARVGDAVEVLGVGRLLLDALASPAA
jgi:ribose-phosphate pyrophosphokinase